MKFLSVSFFYSVSGVDGVGIRLRKEITSTAPEPPSLASQAPPQQNSPKDEEPPEVLSQTPDAAPKEADEQIKHSDILISEGLARAVGEKAASGRFAGLDTCLAVWQEVTHPVVLAAIATSEVREEAELQGQTRTGRSCLGGPPTNAYRWLFDQNAPSMGESFSPDERAARAFGTACLFHLRTADVAEEWGTRAGALAAQAAVWESEVLNLDPGLSCRVVLWQLHVVLLKIVMRHLWEDGGGSAVGGFDLRHTEGTGSTTGPRSLNKVQFALEFFHGGHFKIYDDGYLFHMLTNVLKFRIPTTQELFSSSSARDVVRRVDGVLPYSWTLVDAKRPTDAEGFLFSKEQLPKDHADPRCHGGLLESVTLAPTIRRGSSHHNGKRLRAERQFEVPWSGEQLRSMRREAGGAAGFGGAGRSPVSGITTCSIRDTRTPGAEGGRGDVGNQGQGDGNGSTLAVEGVANSTAAAAPGTAAAPDTTCEESEVPGKAAGEAVEGEEEEDNIEAVPMGEIAPESEGDEDPDDADDDAEDSSSPPPSSALQLHGSNGFAKKWLKKIGRRARGLLWGNAAKNKKRSRGYTGRAVLYGVAYEEAGEEIGTFRAFTYLQTELAPWYTMRTTAVPWSSLLRGINFHHTHVAAQFFALCKKAGNRGKQVGLLTGYQPGDRRRGKKEEEVEEERFGDGVRGSARCGSEHVDSLPLVIQPPLDAVGRVVVTPGGNRPPHSALEELLYIDGALQSGEEVASCEWRTRDSWKNLGPQSRCLRVASGFQNLKRTRTGGSAERLAPNDPELCRRIHGCKLYQNDAMGEFSVGLAAGVDWLPENSNWQEGRVREFVLRTGEKLLWSAQAGPRAPPTTKTGRRRW